MKKTTVYNCSIIELPKIHNRAGNITPINGLKNALWLEERVVNIPSSVL